MKNLPPEISIIAPMFNVEKFLDICLDSIFAQTFSNFELIFIDDCSTDRSVEIFQRRNDPRIRLIHNVKNLGAGFTRNNGLGIARGKYVYFLDPDDAILPQTLEIFHKAAEESGAEVVFMNSRLNAIDPNFQVNVGFRARKMFSADPKPRFMSENLRERLQHEQLESGVLWEPWIKFYRRDFLLEKHIYFPRIFGCDDWLMNIATLCLTKKAQVIDACCYVFRPNPSSITRTPALKSWERMLEQMSRIIAYLEEIFARPEMKDLSRENQIILESHLIYSLFWLDFRYKPIPIATMDQIIREMPKTSDTSEALRVLIHTLGILLSQTPKAGFKLK